MGPDHAELVAKIYNAAWMVRYYARGGRTTIARAKRSEAIQAMGRAVREAFNASEDFEPLLIAIVTSLSRSDDPPF